MQVPVPIPGDQDSGKATASLVCGLIGLVFAFIPLCWFISGRLGILAVIGAIVGLIIVVTAVNDFSNCLNDSSTC